MARSKSKQSEDVPKAMLEKFNSIVAITDEFAQQHLNAEYAQLIRQATAALCRKRPSPIEKGQPKTWACGITHTIGMTNFLFDSSQDPHISASDLYRWFGVAMSTGQGKSKLVRDTLKMGPLDPTWCLPSHVEDNPLIWLLSVNGIMMDIRQAPLGAQIEAFRQGFIPYIPGHQEDSETIAAILDSVPAQPRPPQRKTRKAKQKTPNPAALQALYVLELDLIEGPVTDQFVAANPRVSRTIEIRGDQTLEALHHVIFAAFDREEEHLYEFQLNGQGPYDPNADRYGVALDFADNSEDPTAGDVDKTPIGALGLEAGDFFSYRFDFGDEWWHQIEVMAVMEPQPNITYPRITQRIGASPPQYAEFED